MVIFFYLSEIIVKSERNNNIQFYYTSVPTSAYTGKMSPEHLILFLKIGSPHCCRNRGDLVVNTVANNSCGDGAT